MKSAFGEISAKDMAVALLDLVLPRHCVVCGGRLLLRERFICLECLSDLPLTRYWQLSHNPMADKFNARIQAEIDKRFSANAAVSPSSGASSSSPSPDFLSSGTLAYSSPLNSYVPFVPQQPGAGSYVSPVPHQSGAGVCEPYAYAAALFFYNSESGYKKICQHLKYQGGIESGRYFSAKLGRFLAGSELFKDVDTVIPVPLHWTRHRSRGYNQAEVIARELAVALKASLRTDVLVRTRRTRMQTRLSVASKSDNVSGAFAVRQHCPQARHILLVDDTFTTGATLDACRTALREVISPSVRISVAALAFVVA